MGSDGAVGEWSLRYRRETGGRLQKQDGGLLHFLEAKGLFFNPLIE